MKLYILRCSVEPDVFGFTPDPTGANLPHELGPWRSAGGGTAVQAYAGGIVDGLAPSDPIMKAIERDGFYLARSGLVISSAPEPGRSGAKRRGASRSAWVAFTHSKALDDEEQA